MSLGAPPGMPSDLGTDMLGPLMVNERSADDPNNFGPKPCGSHWPAGRVSPGEPNFPLGPASRWAREPESPRARRRGRPARPASPGARAVEARRAHICDE